MRFASLSLVVALAASASAQQVTNESLTGTPWTHTTTVGTWKNGIADTRSLYGKVDHLVTGASFTYTRAPLNLNPGTYVVVARFAKTKAATGTAPIDLRAIGGKVTVLTTASSEQKLNKFIHTRSLLLTITTRTPVLFFLQNTDTKVTKTDYLFDSFHVGKVERGLAVHVESLTRRWSHAWGAPHYCKEVADKTATYGFVEHLNPVGSSNCGTGSANLWWFRWNSSPRTFLPGVHTGSMRIKKMTSANGAHNFTWFVQVSTDAGATWKKLASAVWDKSTHVVGQWVYSPNLSINVTNPAHLYRWRLDAYTGPGNSFKSDYYFDSFEVRRGEYTPFGKSCMNGGTAKMSGTIPQLGHKFEMQVGPLGSANAVTMIFGLANPNLDLRVVGWPGCTQYARLDILVGMPVTAGLAKLTVTMPTTPTLLGVKWYTSAYQATTTGLATTNGVLGTIGN
jgi:hypothetical protein